jgi:tetratricopeptide (TPR) repeat protein
MPPAPVHRIARALRAAFLVACLLGPLAGASAFASAPGGAPAERQARELFQKAEMSFNLGRFADALADYQGAYEAKPLPAFLFNIAQCYRNLKNYERARFFYRRYLTLDPHSANRHLVEDLIAEMTRAIDKGDGSAAAASGAAAPGAATAVNLVPPEPTAPVAAPVVLAQADAAAPPQSARPIYKRWWFWAGVGGVVAGAIITGIVVTRPDTPQGSLGTINGR